MPAEALPPGGYSLSLNFRIRPNRTLVRLDQKVGYEVQRTSPGSLHSCQFSRPKLT